MPASHSELTPPINEQMLTCLHIALQELRRPISLARLRHQLKIAEATSQNCERVPGALALLGIKAGVVSLDPHQLAALPLPCLVLHSHRQHCCLLLRALDDGYLARDGLTPVPTAIPRACLLQWAKEGADLLLIADLPIDMTLVQQIPLRLLANVAIPVAIASLLINILALGAPIASMIVFNKVLPYAAVATLNAVTLFAAIILVLEAMLRVARGFVATEASARFDAILAQRVTAHVLHLPLRFFEKNATGSIIERLRQLDVLRSFFSGHLPIVLVDAVFALFLLCLLLAADWRLGGIALAALPMFFGTAIAFDHLHKQMSLRAFQTGAAVSTLLHETIANALTVKTLALEPELGARLSRHEAVDALTTLRLQNIGLITSTAGLLLHGLLSLAIVYSGAHFLITDSLSVGELIAANMLIGRILAPVRQVASAWASLGQVRSAYQRLLHLLAESAEDDTPRDHPTMPVGELRLDGVHFRYEENSHTAVLADITFNCPQGEIIAIVGHAGSGKSTVGKLIAGAYQPTQGRITIGGTDIRHLPVDLLRRRLAYVPQECQLFAGTIEDNILLGIDQPSPEKARRAAAFVGADSFIGRLSAGFAANIAERGQDLSLGQRQLICLARAIARQAQLIVLDEATSALDEPSEAAFLSRLRTAVSKNNLSVVMITHRATALRFCDRIVVLSQGRITHRTTPSQLLSPSLPTAP